MTHGTTATRHHDAALGGEVFEITGPAGTARVGAMGGHVLDWRPSGQPSVLWLSPVSCLDGRRGVRGGIPVCWPWFANHPSDPGKPSHGFVRTRFWRQPGGARGAADGVLRLDAGETAGDLWPHRAHLTIEVTAGATLTVALTTRNTGSSTIPLTQALHTYFAIGDIADIAIDGFDGLTYMDKLDRYARKRQSGAIRFSGEVDRIYVGHTGAAEIIDPRLGRRIRITKRGSASSVVWNPWIAKSAELGDIDRPGETGGYRRMVCVETANAGDDIVTLAPGGTHTIAAEITVAPL